MGGWGVVNGGDGGVCSAIRYKQPREPIGPDGVPERLHTAQHEAGHAVVTRLLAGFSSGGARLEVGSDYTCGDVVTPSLGCLLCRWKKG